MSAVRAVRAVRAVTVRATSRGDAGARGRAVRASWARAMMDSGGDGDDDDVVVVRDGDDVAVGDAGEGGEGGDVSLVDVGASEASEASERETRLAREIMASESAVEVAEDDYRGNLRLFLDSADAETYDAWLPTGMFTGVTTNPAILERDGVECGVEALSALARNALEFDAVDEFQVQTWGEDSDEMWENGIALARLDPERLVVKVPATMEGIKAANALVVDGVRVTITAAYAPHQVLVAASIGANYVAPYLGRMNDAGRDGMGTIVSMQETVEELESDMRVLVASAPPPSFQNLRQKDATPLRLARRWPPKCFPILSRRKQRSIFKALPSAWHQNLQRRRSRRGNRRSQRQRPRFGRHGVCTGRKRCECGLNLVSVHPGRFRALLDQ